MSELCFSSTLKAHFSSFFISDLISFGSFIFSYPLYLSYFIFFSPYLFKLISFLSPLFVTTFLLFLSLLTLVPSFRHTLFNQSSSADDDQDELEEFQCMEDLEVYKIVFGESEVELREIPVEILEKKTEENSVDLAKLEEKRLDDFLKVLDEFETMTCNVELVKKVESTTTTTTTMPTLTPGAKADEFVEKDKEKSLTRNGSEETGDVTSKITDIYKTVSSDKTVSTDNGGEHTAEVKSPEGRNLGTYGSMRKEKEWKRTLACKLFEERHNVDGGEGMDSLWETYEVDLDKSKPKSETKKMINSKNKNNNNNNNKKNKKSESQTKEQDNDEEIDGQLCCLQALKFSAGGKMNLGIGRPNVVRNISKAIKGIGWLHNVRRQGKKVHHHGDR